MLDSVWLSQAIKFVMDCSAEKLSKGDITVYRVKGIIRVDIKDRNYTE